MKVKLGSLILIIFFVCVSLSYAIEKNTIVGIWLFDEGQGDVTKDSYSNGHDGKILGDLKWVDGKFDGALSFPGKTGSYVSIPHDDSLSLTTFSMAAWIKFGTTGTTERILIKGSATTNYSYYLSTRGGNVFSYTGFSTSGQGGWVEAFGTTAVTDEKWHHVAATCDKKSLRLYVDGKMEAETAVTGKPFEIKDPVAIGAESDGNYSANGVIDDVGLFNVGLTEDDIKSIMTKGIGEATGIAAVSFAGKSATAWGKIKIQY
jgi:hypothetical protein